MRLIKFVLIFFAVLVFLSAFLFIASYSLLPRLQQNVAILVLGKGGEGHTAPDLTDTIMLVWFNLESKKITLLSLPRDIWIPAIRAKINTAYHYGGFEMAADSVYYITGIKPTFYVVVDFSLFKDLINAIGGVNVDVANSFVDEKYPIAGLENDLCNGDPLYSCRYETLNFEKGIQKMDGETALKFVRSRNALGDEGTDLAREARQQKVIEAVKNKLLSSEVIKKPEVIKKLYQLAMSHIETNIDKKVAISIARFVYESRDKIKFLSIPEDFIKISKNDKKYDYQYVFLAASGTWNEFQEWINSKI